MDQQNQFRQFMNQNPNVIQQIIPQNMISPFTYQQNYQPTQFLKRKARIQIEKPKTYNVEEILTNSLKQQNEQNFIEGSLQDNPVNLIRNSKNFRFGNYKKYYTLRYEKRWNDPRLAVLNKSFFYQKKVLDVGCNDGTLTLLIAMRYFPSKIQGVDIDYTLINKAIENMARLEKAHRSQEGEEILLLNENTSNQIEQISPEEKVPSQDFENTKNPSQQSKSDKKEEKLKVKSQEIMKKLIKLPKCFLLNIEDKASENLDQIYVIQNIKQISKSDENIQPTVSKFPQNVQFRIENFIQDIPREYILREQQYDTIMCLSTTKWIHLNWGDDGIRRLFSKINSLLRPKGHFILEPQNWKSYKKKKYFCPDFKKVYKSITLKPEHFADYLLQKHNFKLIQEIKPDDVEVIRLGKSAFKRTIYIFQK